MTKAEREALKAEFIAGDYRTIKEFAEEKGIAYTGNFRNDVAREHWWKDKQAHAKRVQSAIVASALYRINEIERGLLNYDKGSGEDAKSRLAEVIDAIKGASKQ